MKMTILTASWPRSQAIAAYRQAAVAFAGMTGTGQQLRAAEAELRRAGRDEVTGLVALPIAALQFTDVRADGARIAAVCGSITGGRTWVASGRVGASGSASNARNTTLTT